MESTLEPTNSELILMLSAFILVVILFLWRRFAPSRVRSKLVLNHVKKAWILLCNEDQKVAFTRLILEAAKADGIVTGDESEAIYEEMDMDYKKKAGDLTLDKMYSILNTCDAEMKNEILQALTEMLISDGEYAPMEKEWLDGVKKKLG